MPYFYLYDQSELPLVEARVTQHRWSLVLTRFHGQVFGGFSDGLDVP